MAKGLNSSTLLSQIPDRPTNARTDYRLCDSVKIFTDTEYVSATNPIVCQFVAIRGMRGLCGIWV